MSKYLLMNKNKIVAAFDYITGEITIYDKLPLVYSDINSWLNGRQKFVCAYKRENVYAFLDHIGLYSKEDFINKTHCISIHDTYWVKRPDDKITWENISPYTNQHSEIVQTYALENIILDKKPENIISPIFELSGNAPCCIKYKDNKAYYIKAECRHKDTKNNKIFYQDPFAEYYASVIAKYLNFNAVNYSIREYIKYDKTSQIITECELFTNETYGTIPARYIGLEGYDNIIDYCKSLSEKSYNTCLDMLLLDCVTLNFDRHGDNILFFVNNDTQEILGITPMFDYNCTLLSEYAEESNKMKIVKILAKSNKNIEETYKIVRRHKDYTKELQSLKKLKLTRPEEVPISDNKLQFFNTILQCQVDTLLNIV